MALFEVVDLIGQSPLSPDVGVLDVAREALDEGLDALGHVRKVGFLDVRTDDVKDFVVALQCGLEILLSVDQAPGSTETLRPGPERNPGILTGTAKPAASGRRDHPHPSMESS